MAGGICSLFTCNIARPASLGGDEAFSSAVPSLGYCFLLGGLSGVKQLLSFKNEMSARKLPSSGSTKVSAEQFAHKNRHPHRRERKLQSLGRFHTEKYS